MFEKFHKPTNKNTLEILMNEQYNQQYFEECKYIWQIMFLKTEYLTFCRENC